MSKARFAAVIGMTGFAFAATLLLENKTDAVASFHAKVGVEEYSIADATNAMSGASSETDELEVLMAVTDVPTLAEHLPKPALGWHANTADQIDQEYITEFGRSLAQGRRPTQVQLWPAGAMVVDENGRVLIDPERSNAIYGGTREVSAALYENGMGKLLVSVEKLPEGIGREVRLSDLGVSSHLKRDRFEVNGQIFHILSEHGSPHVLIRGFVDNKYVIDVRGTAYVDEITELLESIDYTALAAS